MQMIFEGVENTLIFLLFFSEKKSASMPIHTSDNEGKQMSTLCVREIDWSYALERDFNIHNWRTIATAPAAAVACV